jgi:hypothetical protein
MYFCLSQKSLANAFCFNTKPISIICLENGNEENFYADFFQFSKFFLLFSKECCVFAKQSDQF